MRRTKKIMLFTLIFTAGLASLLASSTPPPLLKVTTMNNFENDYGDVAYACRGESITLSWNERASDGTLSLSAEPPESFVPPLEAREVESSGTLEAAVQGNAELILSDEEDERTLRLELLPSDICQDFAFPLVGWYQGTLEQNTPEPETFRRELAFYVSRGYGAEALSFRLEIARTLGAYPSLGAPCTLDLPAAQLNCSYSYDSGETFELSARITQSGLSGSYSGVDVTTTSAVPFSGTLNFTKQPGIPPREER